MTQKHGCTTVLQRSVEPGNCQKLCELETNNFRKLFIRRALTSMKEENRSDMRGDQHADLSDLKDGGSI